MVEKKLGAGFMRMPLLDSEDQHSIDMEQLEKMVDLFFERGFTYCDTAWMYHDFISEEIVGKAVVNRHNRDEFTVATKMPVMMLTNADEVPKIFEEQKRKLNVNYFDYYLLHDMSRRTLKTAQKLGVIDFVTEKKKSGEIKCLGFSSHDDPGFIDQMLTEYPFLEFVQLQINYLDWESSGIQARKCYEVAVKHGKDIIVMEPVKGGTLADPLQVVKDMLKVAHPDWTPAEWAIRFAASLPHVKLVLSGMSNFAQMDENTAFMENFEPLTKEDNELLLKAAEMIRQAIAIPCTGCRYCVEATKCPKNIAIPNYFALYNTKQLMKNALFSPEVEYYHNLVMQGYGAAGDCISCKKCEKVCPQHIHIHEWMPKVEADMKMS